MKHQIESMKLKHTTSGRIHDATLEEIALYEKALKTLLRIQSKIKELNNEIEAGR